MSGGGGQRGSLVADVAGGLFRRFISEIYFRRISLFGGGGGSKSRLWNGCAF